MNWYTDKQDYIYILMKKFPQNSILITINYPHSIIDLDTNKVDNYNLAKSSL